MSDSNVFSSSKSEECDLCGKVTYAPIHRNGHSFCPDCWNEVQGYVNDPTKLLEEINKIHSDVVKIRCGGEVAPKNSDPIERNNMADLVKAAKDIAKELHELNKNLNLRNPFNISQGEWKRR